MSGKFRFVFSLAIILAACQPLSILPTATPTPIPAPAPGVLSVEPAAALGTISPYLLGSNYGPWVAIPANRLSEAYDSKITAIRFPGGEWGDHNTLRPYQIDAFMDFCREVGAIPVMTTKLFDGDPQVAADMVRYTNIENQNEVVYWIIGNEPTLFASAMRIRGIADDYDTVQFNREWRAMAEAMKEVDPNIKVMGPEVHQFTSDHNYNPKDSSGRDWMIEFLKANGDMVDVVTFHRYPFPKSMSQITETIADLRENTREWDHTIDYLRELIMEHTGRDIPIAVTEVNTHYTKAFGGEATPDSHYNAIWLADVLGRLMQKDVFMFNHWLITAPAGQGGWGMINRGELRPSYFVYQLYNKFGSQLVYAGSGVEDVDIFAAMREDGKLTLIVINLAETEKQARLQVQGKAPEQAEVWLLDPNHHAEGLGTISFSDGGGISLPPQSVSLLILNP